MQQTKEFIEQYVKTQEVHLCYLTGKKVRVIVEEPKTQLQNIAFAEEIVLLVAQELNTTSCAIKSGVRLREIADARKIAMHLVYKYAALSMLEMEVIFDRDHSSISIAMRGYANLYQTNQIFNQKASRCEGLVLSKL